LKVIAVFWQIPRFHHVTPSHYHRTIIGYHGCDKEIADRVLAGECDLEYSDNAHDWLGRGIYFWEHGPKRAFDWACIRSGSARKIKTPAVVGAYINLGKSFDLLDTQFTSLLGLLYPTFKKTFDDKGIPLPKNEPHPKGEEAVDHVVRKLDCAVLNWCLTMLETGKDYYDTVRCVFQEGVEAFPGSKIMQKSHIQVAVRNPERIIGYFRPNVDYKRR
jgi:hypothetical protein